MALEYLQLFPGLVGHVAPLCAADGLKRLRSTGPAAQQFLAEVSRILEEGTARQETSQEMTGRIANAASVTHLSSLGSQGASGKACQAPRFPLWFAHWSAPVLGIKSSGAAVPQISAEQATPAS